MLIFCYEYIPRNVRRQSFAADFLRSYGYAGLCGELNKHQSKTSKKMTGSIDEPVISIFSVGADGFEPSASTTPL